MGIYDVEMDMVLEFPGYFAKCPVCGREGLKKRRIFVPDFLKTRTPQTRIRKAYKRKIEMTGKPSAFASPKELEDQAGLPQGEKREEFHGLYEKARYGNAPCTQEEAKRMWELERVDFS